MCWLLWFLYVSCTWWPLCLFLCVVSNIVFPPENEVSKSSRSHNLFIVFIYIIYTLNLVHNHLSINLIFVIYASWGSSVDAALFRGCGYSNYSYKCIMHMHSSKIHSDVSSCLVGGTPWTTFEWNKSHQRPYFRLSFWFWNYGLHTISFRHTISPRLTSKVGGDHVRSQMTLCLCRWRVYNCTSVASINAVL